MPLPPSAWPPQALQTMVALPDHNRPIDHQTSVLLRIRKCERTAPWQLAKINVVLATKNLHFGLQYVSLSVHLVSAISPISTRRRLQMPIV